jgi:hypothetical protein
MYTRIMRYLGSPKFEFDKTPSPEFLRYQELGKKSVDSITLEEVDWRAQYQRDLSAGKVKDSVSRKIPVMKGKVQVREFPKDSAGNWAVKKALAAYNFRFTGDYRPNGDPDFQCEVPDNAIDRLLQPFGEEQSVLYEVVRPDAEIKSRKVHPDPEPVPDPDPKSEPAPVLPVEETVILEDGSEAEVVSSGESVEYPVETAPVHPHRGRPPRKVE